MTKDAGVTVARFIGSLKNTAIELGDDTVSFCAGILPIMVGGVVSVLPETSKVQLRSAAKLLPDKSAIAVVIVMVVNPSGSGVVGINSIIVLLRGYSPQEPSAKVIVLKKLSTISKDAGVMVARSIGSSKDTVIELGDDTVAFSAGLLPVKVGGVVSVLPGGVSTAPPQAV